MPRPASARRPSMVDRLRQLEGATSVLITEASLVGVLQRVVEVAGQVTGARYAAIGVLGPDRKILESFTTYGTHPAREGAADSSRSDHDILGLIVREARPVRLADLIARADSRGLPATNPMMHSFLGVPIIDSRGIAGSLFLAGKNTGEQFTGEDEDIAVLLSARTAAAIDNARHHEESARLLEEVQQLHRARERFFAMVNHELRNALAAVYGWSEMLIRKRDPATVPHAAFEVLESAERAIGLINDLLDLSRLDEDRLKPVIAAVEPTSIARHAMERVTPAADRKSVVLQIASDPDLPNCETDASRVEQILVNLLGNAIRYAPMRSTVRIRITADGGRVRYQVDDDGPGVPPDETERIFDVYVTSAGEESRGLGLGLPLSRRLARLLGGELNAVSRPEGGGRFILEVPAAAA
ncbi:MAG TPA: ATP-binding protein [Gemmatimonadaceae bacterium]|nr:ATP-binding protein [Gemmatimonadaceae bacterium]